MGALLAFVLCGQCGPSGCWLPPARQSAILEIEVIPPTGRLELGGHAVTLQNGRGRFLTPPLIPGRRYEYVATVNWEGVARQWTLRFAPGETAPFVLRQDPPTSAQQNAPRSPSASQAPPKASPEPKPAAPAKPPELPGTLAASLKPFLPPALLEPPTATSLAFPGLSSGMPASESTAALLAALGGSQESDGLVNFGIDRSRLNGGERITLDGHQITRAEASEALESGGLTDDSKKLRLTVIGDEAERRRVRDDLKGPLSDVAAQCLVQDYPPDHWAVAKAGFYTNGRPTIYVQAADGKVLHRQDDYADGPDGLRRAFERLRRPDPDYQPKKDRDLRVLDLLAFPARVVLSWLLAAAIVFVIAVLLLKGWLSFLLRALVALVPGPPKQHVAETAATQEAAESAAAQQGTGTTVNSAIAAAVEKVATVWTQQLEEAQAAKEAAIVQAVNEFADRLASRLTKAQTKRK